MSSPVSDPFLDALRRLVPLDPAKLETARRRAELQNLPLHRALVDLGFVAEETAYRAAAESQGLDFVVFAETDTVPREVLDRVPSALALEHRFAPLSLDDGSLVAAFAEPPSLAELGRLRLLLGLRVRPRLCGPAALREFVRRHYGLGADTIQRLRNERGPVAGEGGEIVFDLQGNETEPEDPTIIHFVDQLLTEALRLEATDIHLEPFAGAVKLRYRIDGLLQDVPLPEGLRAHYGALISRLKVMADLDITERRVAHDGRIAMSRGGAHYDLRVSIIPTPHGETVCLRVLGRDKLLLDLGHLGMEPAQRALMEELAGLPQGLALITGPTGSGKTTTLYALLASARDGRRKIITLEDPVEYKLDGVTQIQTRAELGLDFASGLRSVLRHDPDVILVGEIRDEETAQIAVEAALTGHLLVSTLHTNDAPSTVARIGEMGVEPFNISASLVCVCAQRLLRRVCKNCKQPYEPAGREKDLLERAIGWSGQIFKANPNGCPACNGLGYKGRIGIHELMTNSEELTAAINKEAEVAELKRIAMKDGMKTLHQDSMLKVKLGLTTIEEALANVPPDLIL